MTIILTGTRGEIRKWIRKQERITGVKFNYVGAEEQENHCTFILKEGTKEDCPKLRTVRRHIERSEEISE